MKEITKTVLNASGIHARPAGIFIHEAKKFQSKIESESSSIAESISLSIKDSESIAAAATASAAA